GVAVAGAAGIAADPRTGPAAAMACMAACAARPRDAPSLNSIWQWNGPRPGCRGPGSALREGARPVPDAAGMLHPARSLSVSCRHARAAAPGCRCPAACVPSGAGIRASRAGTTPRRGGRLPRRHRSTGFVDLDHHRLVADLLEVHAVEAVADRTGGLQ